MAIFFNFFHCTTLITPGFGHGTPAYEYEILLLTNFAQEVIVM